jgi:pilus assembly protein CpaF
MGLKNRIATAVTDEQEVGRNGDVQFYRKRLLEEIDLSEMASLSLTQRRARLERVVGHLVSREGPVLSNRDRAALIRRVVDEALGLGVLEPLLADEDVTEIMVNGAGDVFIERAGRIERVDTRFTSEDQL